MISLNYRDSRPIYEQIRDGLRKLIVTGALGADEKLPSVRALAAQLAINPNTIQRAYNELEGEGYIYSVPGKGSFAAPEGGAGAPPPAARRAPRRGRRDERGPHTVGGGAGNIPRPPAWGFSPAPLAPPDSARRAELLAQVRELLSELRYLGASQQELLDLVKEVCPS